ncbi:MAG: hypothetical protein LBT11_01100 [Treponema sp.]|jgi:hypothetical protein|nr:hypothetical protein [Treponema sp.]
MKKLIVLVVFGFIAATGFAQSATFPAGFQGTWKRPHYASTLTFTSSTVKASNRDVVWTLRSVSGNLYTMVSSGTGAALLKNIREVHSEFTVAAQPAAKEA